VLADGRRGVLRREVADFLNAGLGLAGRAAPLNPGRILLTAGKVAAWVAGRGGRPVDGWAVPRDQQP
jgi:hypothetical protein